jgi:dTDP-4-dehydrorhamnose 3,5-epimerase-like enzyme
MPVSDGTKHDAADVGPEVVQDPEHPLQDGLARWVAIPRHQDARGVLRPMDFEHLPFLPRRAFVIGGVPAGTRRGAHAHRRNRQLLLALAGTIVVSLRCQDARAETRLTPDGPALLIEAGVWAAQEYLSPDSLLLVLASEVYDPESFV